METAIIYWGYIWNNGKGNGNYYSILDIYIYIELETII